MQKLFISVDGLPLNILSHAMAALLIHLLKINHKGKQSFTEIKAGKAFTSNNTGVVIADIGKQILPAEYALM